MRLSLVLTIAAAAATLAIVVLLGVVGAGAPRVDPTAGSQRGPPPAPPALWSTDDFWLRRAELEREWDWACAVVEWVCRVRFEERPSIEACSTSRYREIRGGGRHGLGFEIGFADATRNAVFLHPQGLERCRHGPLEGRALPRNVRRLVLVHEATHALDDQRFPRLCSPASHGGTRSDARTMLVEGHAWVVTEAVVRALGWDEDYCVFLQAVVGERCREGEADPAFSRMWEVAGTDRYAEALGQRVLQAAQALGGRGLVDSILARPPRDQGGWPAWCAWLRGIAWEPDVDPDAIWRAEGLLGREPRR